jgi:hypothetical protein
MKRRRLIVLGTLASNPYAGMAWMHMQIALGLRRLGHDVYYFETSSSWPYDPQRESRVRDANYAVPYLSRVAESFGFEGSWAYRSSFSDKSWAGMARERAESLLSDADAVFNVAGSTRLEEEGLHTRRLVYLGTDPVYHEIAVANGDAEITRLIDEHDDFVTYGENIGTSRSPIPPLPGLRARTRQPVVTDLWDGVSKPGRAYTTVGNWRQSGHDIEFDGELLLWSKHHEFLKLLDLPRRVEPPLEIALGLAQLDAADRKLLESHGWRLSDAHRITTDPWPYRDYVMSSRAEFTVARDQNVRLRSGWFSERSACYLAAGRPVVTQETGFSDVLPTGRGLFAFETVDEAAAAIESIESDYDRHSRAAVEVAREHFHAETVLARLLDELGV